MTAIAWLGRITYRFDRELPGDSKPIMFTEKIEVARRPKTISHPDSTTNGHMNGTSNGHVAIGKRKREIDDVESEEQAQVKKRGRVVEQSWETTIDDVVVVEDEPSNGAIMIEDD